MKTYYYRFSDGFYCYTMGRMPKCEKVAYAKEHGKLLVEKVA